MSEKEKNPLPEEKKELYRYQARIRAGSTIRQLVKENNLRYMWTLTYRNDVTSRDEALNDFILFVKRLSYALGKKIDYVAVIEVQKKRKEKTGKAVLHFHMATNLFIKHELMEEKWRHGYVYVSTYTDGKKIQGKNDVGSYLSKYLKKDMEENPELAGKKMYLNSRGLRRPNKGHGVATDEDKEEVAQVAKNFEIAEGITGSSLNIKELINKPSCDQLEKVTL